VLALSAWRSARARRESGPAARVSVGRLVPWFLVGFLCASLLTTLGLIPAPAAHAATTTAKFLIVVALTGVGLSADFRQMARTGFKPLLLGALLWATVAVTSLAVQRLTGQWL
ncbi:MAG TPA: putative sulfate exporter family transporter, partial [Symbiobacteriaceae bacterium]|nr:putative sulfate exporter family transporter [Symbiobacteriaceae bacterium]